MVWAIVPAVPPLTSSMECVVVFVITGVLCFALCMRLCSVGPEVRMHHKHASKVIPWMVCEQHPLTLILPPFHVHNAVM